MKRLKKVDAAFIAGCMDCDGHIGLFRRKRSAKQRIAQEYYFRPVVQIQQNKRALVEFISEVCGTARPWFSKKRGMNGLRIRESDVRDLLEQILPYLKLKRRQAELVIEFDSRRRHQGVRLSEEEIARREAIHAELAILNKRPADPEPVLALVQNGLT